MTTTETRSLGGTLLILTVREDTNDAAIANAILTADEYDLRSSPPLSGWALDVGSHIGAIAISLAVDHPDLRVVAIEAVPDNADLIRQNVEAAGFADRVFVENAGAAAPGEKTVSITYGYRWVGKDGGSLPVVPHEYVNQCRFIGNIFEYPSGQQDAITKTVPALSLSKVMRRYGMERVALLKIDCEGCEWAFLRDRSIGKVDRIVGEYHGSGANREQGMERVHGLLDKTHVVTHRTGLDIGLFEAVAR